MWHLRVTENLEVHQIVLCPDVQTCNLRLLCHRCHVLCHELARSGKIQFKGPSHHSRWNTLKYAVKKELGLGIKNMFSGTER